MRKLELIRAIKRVLNALAESHVADILSMPFHTLPKGAVPSASAPERDRDRDRDRISRDFLLGVFQSYSVAASLFGPIEKELCTIFRFDILFRPDFWDVLISRDTLDDDQILDDQRWAYAALKRLKALVGPEADYTEFMPSAKAIHGLESVSVVVLEEKGQGSTPTRLIRVLEGITALYEAHTTVLSLPVDTLIVTACDSGSDKAFDFLGLAKAIQALKETILSLWDRIFFFRERKLSVHLSLISQSLPVLAEISALEEKKVLGREEAEILRRKVVHGATALAEAGAVIPDVTAKRPESFRILAAPESKLLAPPDLPPESEGSIGNAVKRKPRRKKRGA